MVPFIKNKNQGILPVYLQLGGTVQTLHSPPRDSQYDKSQSCGHFERVATLSGASQHQRYLQTSPDYSRK